MKVIILNFFLYFFESLINNMIRIRNSVLYIILVRVLNQQKCNTSYRFIDSINIAKLFSINPLQKPLVWIHNAVLYGTVKSDLLQLVCIHVEERGEVGDEVSTDLGLLRGLPKFAGLLKQRKGTLSSLPDSP